VTENKHANCQSEQEINSLICRNMVYGYLTLA